MNYSRSSKRNFPVKFLTGLGKKFFRSSERITFWIWKKKSPTTQSSSGICLETWREFFPKFSNCQPRNMKRTFLKLEMNYSWNSKSSLLNFEGSSYWNSGRTSLGGRKETLADVGESNFRNMEKVSRSLGRFFFLKYEEISFRI